MTNMSSGPTRVAVIGVGHLGRHHARILSSQPDVTMVAAVDLVAERAEAAAAASASEALTDYRALFGRVDAVVVAVPTVAHLAVAREFLTRGVHVLVEKPMAVSLAEADEMIAAADRSGATLAVGHTERFNPAFVAAAPILATPRFIEVHRLGGFPERSLDIDVIFDVMIHDLDIVLAVDGSDVVAVEAIGVPVLTSRADIANARLTMASGCIANLTASRISRDKVRKVRFFQPDMYVSVDYQAQELDVWRLRKRDGERPAIEGGKAEVVPQEPLAGELIDFISAIRLGRSPRVPGADGRRALALATRVAEKIGETDAGQQRAKGKGQRAKGKSKVKRGAERQR
jgi:predicted dehydrogenase